MNTNRWLHIDFHTLPGVTDFCAEFDADQFADTLKAAEVTRVNLFAQCNTGFSYYPTKVGIPYPGMKGDMFGDSVRACRERGIDVVGYINVGVNHELALRHPEFCHVNKKGQIIDDVKMNSFCRNLCYNNPGYIAYTKEIIKELLQYDISGVFLDCAYVMPCYCSKCMQEMLDAGIDYHDDAQVYQFAQDKTIEYTRIMRSLLPEGFSLYVNSLAMDRVQGIDTHAEIECLPGGWGYDFFPGSVAYARNLYEDVVYMTGRFQISWGDFGGYRTVESIEYDAFDSLMYCCGFSVGDHMHPRGKLDETLYKDISRLYKWLKAYEPWTDGTHYLKEVAILRNRSKVKSQVLTPSLRGAARMLGELKYNFDIINEDMDFAPYKLIILADTFAMDAQVKEKLSRFAKAGGAILSTNDAGICKEEKRFVLDEFQFLSYEGQETGCEPGWAGFYRPEGDTREYNGYYAGILMKNLTGTTLAEHVQPYFPWHYDGRHAYLYIPPKAADGYSTVAIKDRFAHVSFPVFSAYYQYSYGEHRKLIEKLLNRLIEKPMILADTLPVTSRVSLTGNEDYTLLHVKVTYPEGKGQAPAVEEHNVLPAGGTVKVQGAFHAVCRLPDGEKMKAQVQDGYTTVCLPEIRGYDMFLLK